MSIKSHSGTNLILGVLFSLELDRNLLGVGQFLENGFKINFGDKKCAMFFPKSQEICEVKMRGRSFSFESNERKVHYLSKSRGDNRCMA